MATYTAKIQETNEDIDKLAENHYDVQVAKSVSSPTGTPTFNIVFSSEVLANNMNVEWTTIYGLNWSAKVPTAGAKVEFGGLWQSCDLGRSFDLNDKGQWVPNQSNPNADKNSLNVGNNGYKLDVHIIVGVKNSENGTWTPIWIGENKLLKNAHGEYMPRQSIKIWYEEGTRTATMITNQGTAAVDFDMSTNPVYYFSYSTAIGKWLIPQPKPYFPALAEE